MSAHNGVANCLRRGVLRKGPFDDMGGPSRPQAHVDPGAGAAVTSQIITGDDVSSPALTSSVRIPSS